MVRYLIALFALMLFVSFVDAGCKGRSRGGRLFNRGGHGGLFQRGHHQHGHAGNCGTPMTAGGNCANGSCSTGR